MLKKLLPSLLAISAGMAAAPAHASDFLWTDTYLSYRYLWQDKQPGTYRDVKEHAVNLSHADEWDYGANFFSLDVEQFSHQDPSNAATNTYNSKSTGSGEFYGLFRSSLSGNKVFATKALSYGPIKDVSLQVGADWCTQNDAFGSNKKMIVVGPKIDIAMPKGFWDISIHAAHEWNTNGIHSYGTSGDQADNFDLVPEFETAWLYPIVIGPVPMKFTGYANLIGPKGKGTSSDAGHTTEFLAHPKLMFDVGAMAGGKPGKVDAGVGYEYWLNKFGTRSSASAPNPVQQAFFFEVGYHFN